MRTIVWGLQLSELLLIAVTTVYTVLTAVLATQAWKQRRDTARAELTVRLRSYDGANHDVEVVNAGPGHAREVRAELRFLPDADSAPVRVATITVPVLLAGETVPTYHDEGAYSLIGVDLRWRDAVGLQSPKPYVYDAAAYRDNVKASELHWQPDPQDEAARQLTALTRTAERALERLQRQQHDATAFVQQPAVWAQVRAAEVVWRWQLQLALGRAIARRLLRGVTHSTSMTSCRTGARSEGRPRGPVRDRHRPRPRDPNGSS